ncbi:hypothetical protein N431DRAFT_560537 [Stipitochalara longipes BDJ]|nr:hypothetical protein N431DRAFT_560537 [Stipitochalara longipes BDJ]
MRTLAEDAEAMLSRHRSSLPEVEYRPPLKPVTLFPIFPNLTPRNFYQYALEYIQQHIPIFRPAQVDSSDPQVAALTEMLLDLKASIFALERLKYPSIFLSIPDTIRLSSQAACNRFQIAAQQAGLEILRPCTSTSSSTLYYHRIWDCFDDEELDLSCRGDIKMPLTISYTGSSLAAGILQRDDGMLEISRKSLDLNLGAKSGLKSEDEVSYWNSVKKLIIEAIGDEEVDALFLLGEDNKDAKFREVIQEILEERGFRKTIEQMMGGFGEHLGDGLWYGARGAAVVARRMMWQGEDACLPNAWCEIASYHDEL